METRTVTIDTANSKYIFANGIETTISGTAEDFTLDFTDTGTGGIYKGGGGDSDIVLANGQTIKVDLDPAFTYFTMSSDATAETNVGSIWFWEDDGKHVEWKIKSCTMANADSTGANNLTQIVLERVDNPMISVTWANLNMA